MSDIEAAKQLFFEALALLDAPDYGNAELRLREALSLAPQNASILTNLSLALIQQNRPQEALTFAEQASNVDPRNVEALLVMANCCAQARQFSTWLATCDRIIGLEPGLAGIHSDRATALNGLRRYGEALASCDRAIAIAPNAANAHTNRGNTLVRLGRLEEALLAYDHALRLKPEFAGPWAGRGHALARQKRYEEALAAYARATKLNVALVTAWVGRAHVLIELRRLDEALSASARAVECNPHLPGGWAARGNALALLHRFDDAIAAYDRALAIEADLAEVIKERGSVYMELNRYDAAFADFDRAFAIRPDLSYLEGERLHAKMHLCEWRSFDADCQHLRASIAAGKAASAPFSLLAIPSSPTEQRKCAEVFAADTLARRPAPSSRSNRPQGHRRIRVAYLSPDFRAHATARLAVGLFEHHDRSDFEITAISFGPDDSSDIRARLVRSFDCFVDVSNKPDRDVTELIRSMDIDIAVDLCGYTRHSRPNILAQRPAPIQVSYLGYPGTMGSAHIDYLIADRILIPHEHRTGYSENIVYLPDTYQVNNREWSIANVPNREKLGLPENRFVFCCFNNSYKITPDVFAVWMRLLREIEKSVLWLLAASPGAMANLRREAGERGVSPDCLIFAPPLTLDRHLARHCQADLFLDTFHCGAHTTASDALWAGLPIVTCCGPTFASRVAASLLTALGLPELITSSPAEYERLALSLAHDPAALAAARKKLATHRETHPLFNDVRLTRHLELAYRMMWERSARGEPPEDIFVPSLG